MPDFCEAGEWHNGDHDGSHRAIAGRWIRGTLLSQNRGFRIPFGRGGRLPLEERLVQSGLPKIARHGIAVRRPCRFPTWSVALGRVRRTANGVSYQTSLGSASSTSAIAADKRVHCWVSALSCLRPVAVNV